MAKLPEDVSKAWEDRQGPIVFSTVAGGTDPNAIYATCVSKFDDETILIADNYFDKTKKNILEGSRGSVLFITDEKKAYQLKGAIEYHQEGALFENMKSWNPEKHPGHAVAALKVEEVYSGSKKLI